jgi:hypothetical protein
MGAAALPCGGPPFPNATEPGFWCESLVDVHGPGRLVEQPIESVERDLI